MSYCRWSCLNGYSDVYVYEDVHGGWTTHVAGSRLPPGMPYASLELLVSGEAGHALYVEASKLQQAWRETNSAAPIPIKGAGGSFNHDSPGECADHLEKLARDGFVVPSWAIASLRAEQAEMDE